MSSLSAPLLLLLPFFPPDPFTFYCDEAEVSMESRVSSSTLAACSLTYFSLSISSMA
jgi:hypothetical protein